MLRTCLAHVSDMRFRNAWTIYPKYLLAFFFNVMFRGEPWGPWGVFQFCFFSRVARGVPVFFFNKGLC